MKRSSVKKNVYKDCKAAMGIVALIFIISECMTGLLAIYCADVLGEFSNAVINMNIAIGITHVLRLLICIVITVFVIPVLEMLGNIIMLKKGLIHDYMVMSRFLKKTYESVKVLEVGDIQHRIENDPIELRIYWLELVQRTAALPIIIVYLLNRIFLIDYKYVILTILVSCIKFIVPVGIKKIESRYDKITREYQNKFRINELEIIEKSYFLKLFSLKQPIVEKTRKFYRDYFQNVYKKNIKYIVLAENTSKVFDVLCIIAILLIGTLYVAKGEILPGNVTAMCSYFLIINRVIEDIGYVIRKKTILDNLVERVSVLYENEESIDGARQEVICIKAKDLSFTYNEKKILEKLNFDIYQGEKVQIVGANGTGKSTLIKLLCGLYEKYEGDLFINEVELRDVCRNSWREQFEYVPQEPYLFEDSVKNNIYIGNLKARNKYVEQIIDELSLSNIMEHQVSMNKHNLSGGEKQKISIARALIRDTPYVFWDEPTNNLDEKTIKKIIKLLKKTKKTVIFTTHDKRIEDIATKKIYL